MHRRDCLQRKRSLIIESLQEQAIQVADSEIDDPALR